LNIPTAFFGDRFFDFSQFEVASDVTNSSPIPQKMRAEIKLSYNALLVGETVPVRELSQRSRNNVDISAVALAVP